MKSQTPSWWETPTAAGPTWEELLDEFCRAQRSPATARAYRQAVLAFHADRGAPPSVLMRDAIQYRDELRAAGRSPATVLARLAATSSWFRHLRRTPLPDGGRLVADNPFEDVRAGRVEAYGRVADRQLELADFKRILAVAAARLRVWLIVHVLTGRRRAEIARLTPRDLQHRGSGWWYRYTGKGRAQAEWRELPAAAAAELFAWRPEVAQGGDGTIWGVSETTLIRAFKAAARAAGVDPGRARAHNLRHLAARLRRADGADIRELQEFLGHRGPGTTAIYLFHLEEVRDTRAASVARQLLG